MYQITQETLELWSANKLSTALPWIPDCSSVQMERFLGILAVYKLLNQGFSITCGRMNSLCNNFDLYNFATTLRKNPAHLA